LAQQQAITTQDLDNATQNNLAAKAQVQSAQAQVATSRAQIVAANAAVQSARATAETARINLGFTRLTSPIDGIPGIAQQQVGSLVSPASPTITTVSTLDPIRVYFTVAEQEYLDFHRRYSTPTILDAERRGCGWSSSWRMELSIRKTGLSTLRIVRWTSGLAPSGWPDCSRIQETPCGRPVRRVRTALRVQPGALLVPQRAVNELQGSYQIAVVDSENKVDIRFVKVGDRVGNLWLISDGLKPGERVVAEGLQKVRQGMQVKPKPFLASNQSATN